MTPDQKEQLEREQAFAAQGQLVVDNEAYKQAFLVRRAQLFDVFCRTKKDQGDIREEAWRTMQNLDALESFFKKALETGKMADSMLLSEQKLN